MTRSPDPYLRLARRLKSLAHPGRLRLLAELMRGDCCVSEMQKCARLSQPQVSQSLRLLRDAGIVAGRREKRRVCYRIVDPAVLKALKILLKGVD
jgi:DNA-binding transcriptional ArsR family regulator